MNFFSIVNSLGQGVPLQPLNHYIGHYKDLHKVEELPAKPEKVHPSFLTVYILILVRLLDFCHFFSGPDLGLITLRYPKVLP